MKTQKQTDSERENPLRVDAKMRPPYENIPLTNPKKEALTPTVLRTFEGFESVSDQEAENICRTSFLLAHILLEYLAQKNNCTIDNQHVVYLRSEEAPVVKMNNIQSKPHKNKAA